ncbi:MAG: hypothetical protein K2W95_09635 [Candidatus Obscuribacterales bacterium]|nr:hypothetical protein [Candidatus Obscuribacterales bacterium]
MAKPSTKTVLIGIWLLCVCLAWTGLLIYERTPGEVATATCSWPAASKLQRAAGGYSLVMFAHPRCPCTRASLIELEKIISSVQDRRLRTYVVFFAPDAKDATWLESDIVETASKMNGVTVVKDLGGTETQRFGAVTSGHLKMYDAGGVLRYSGGITAERGHQGDNAGEDAVIALLRPESPADARVAALSGPVFGCRILPDPGANP